MTTDSRGNELRRFLRAALITVAMFLGLEACLWLLGKAIYPHRASEDGMKALPETIWCLGDSNTQGAGAPPGWSYPEQLARRLAARGDPRGVANLGRGGTNSSIQLATLRAALKRGTPSVVLFMGGSNDAWSLARTDPALLLQMHGVSGLLVSILQRSRTFKLVVNFMAPRVKDAAGPWLGLRPETTELIGLLHAQRGQEVIRWLEGRSLVDDERLILGSALFAAGRYADAASQFERLLPLAPALRTNISVTLLHAEARRLADGESPSPETIRLYENFVPRRGRAWEEGCYWTGKGWLMSALKRFAEARTAFVRARSAMEGVRQPFHYLPDEGIAWSYLLEGAMQKASASFRSVPAQDFGHFDFPFWSHLGRSWVALGRGDEASFARTVAILKRTAPVGHWSRHPKFTDWMRWPESSRAVGRRFAPPLPSQSVLHMLPIAHFLHDSPKSASYLKILEANLEELGLLARSRNFDLVLLGYPQLRLTQVRGTLREFAKRRGFDYIDLLERVGDVETDPVIGATDGIHPNSEGYARIAAEVDARVLVKPSPSR